MDRRTLLRGALAGSSLAASGAWAENLAPLYPRFVPLTDRELFSSRFRFRDRTPALSMGLAEGQRRVELRAPAPLRLHLDEAGLPKVVFLEGPVRLEPRTIRPGRRRHWVLMHAFPYERREDAEAAAKRLGARFESVRVFTLGAVIGLGAAVVDTRQHQVGVLGAPSASKAMALQQKLYRQTGRAPAVLAETAEIPSGGVNVFSGERLLHRSDGRVCIETARTETLEWIGHGSYGGQLYVVPDHQGGLTLINSISAERMLAGLLPAEMFASAPAEALKAQAITARGAVFAKLGHRHLDAPFHLCSQTHCQVYAGVGREDPRTTAAIRATRGRLAVERSNPERLVASVYSSTCGGHTEDNDTVWAQEPSEHLRARLDGSVNDPVLAPFAQGIHENNVRAWVESYPPTFESKSSFVRKENYRWTRSFDQDQLQGLALGVGQVERVEVLGRGRGGRVTGVRVVGSQSSKEILRELPVRRAFRNLKSGLFVVDHERDAAGRLTSVRFTGAGWGHGVGMCQVGAIGRAEQGQDHEQILAHYYNGALVKRFY